MSIGFASPGRFPAAIALLATIALSITAPLPGWGAAIAMRLGGDERPIAANEGFDGVGRLDCRIPGGRAVSRDATGWILGAADTVVTAAHTLFPAGTAIDPKACVFRLFNADGSVRETARVRYVRSPWSEPRYRDDSAHDVAVLKLDRPMGVSAVAATASGSVMGARPVRLISFPADAVDGQARISAGEARPFPLGPARDGQGGMRVSDPSRLFASSVESAAGSSGGLYYAPRSGAAIGLHVGYVCGGDEGCFNFGLRFDAGIVAMIAAVAADASPGKTLLASADLPQG